MTIYDDVGDFHRKFGLDHDRNGTEPRLLSEDEFRFRDAFLVEELTEIRDAHYRGDLAAFLDGLVDLTYVAAGTAQLAALPFNEAWAEVHRANLAKERANGAGDPRSTRGHRLDVVKPAGWQPPDIEAVIERRRAAVRSPDVLEQLRAGVVLEDVPHSGDGDGTGPVSVLVPAATVDLADLLERAADEIERLRAERC